MIMTRKYLTRTISILAVLVLMSGCGGSAKEPVTLTDEGVYTFTATDCIYVKAAKQRLSSGRVRDVTDVKWFVVMESVDGIYSYLSPTDSMYEGMKATSGLSSEPETDEMRVWSNADGTQYFTAPDMDADAAAAYVVSDAYTLWKKNE